MRIQILCTLGPASMNDAVVARLAELGVDLFRLNLSHIPVNRVAEMIEYLQSRSDVPVCLDTEGAQIRTGYLLEDEVVLRENSMVRVPRRPVPGDSRSFNLYPISALDEFQIGDYLTIDDSVLTQVVDLEPSGLALWVLRGGVIRRNKAATLEREFEMTPLTEKDVEALGIGKRLGIRHVALSFANRESDVDQIRSHSAPDAFVISKIECLGGLTHLEAIARRSDALLIDRGDLSRQVPLEKIPLIQKRIIAVGRDLGVPVYVATNLMESMITEPAPTRAEVNDVFNTLLDGADGLVLAAETAVGQYPVGCVSMVRRLIQAFQESERQDPLESFSQPVSLLAEPHGGELVQRTLDASDLSDVDALRSLELPQRDLMACEQIALGEFSPLHGFMDADTVRSVLDHHRLPDGIVWPMPIVLPLLEGVGAPSAGEQLALRDDRGALYALLDVSSVFAFDFAERAEEWFGADVENDPRVGRLLASRGLFVGGKVQLVKRLPPLLGQYQRTPAEMRYVFTKKGWSRAISFHTHSLPHRAHQQIQQRALEETHADGLYVSIETGAMGPGDFTPALILRSYQILLDFGLCPRSRLMLGGAATFGRSAGVREAVLHALRSKNLGFSHVILGRADGECGAAVKQLFARLGPLGVEPVFFDTLGWEPEEREYRSQSGPDVLPLSGRHLRRALEAGEKPPDWFVEPVLRDSLQAELEAGASLFLP